MTTESQARKQAAKQSKTQGAQYVVWVFDQGRDIFDTVQYRTYKNFCDVEAIYINGVDCHEPSYDAEDIGR